MKPTICHSLFDYINITKRSDFTFLVNEKMRAIYFRFYFTMLDNTDEVAAWYTITDRASDALKN